MPVNSTCQAKYSLQQPDKCCFSMRHLCDNWEKLDNFVLIVSFFLEKPMRHDKKNQIFWMKDAKLMDLSFEMPNLTRRRSRALSMERGF